MKKVVFEPSVYLGFIAGHAFMLISGAAYITAWILNYGEQLYMNSDISRTFFSISAAAGLIGAIWLFFSTRSLARFVQNTGLKIYHIILIGSAVFAMVWAGTYWGLHRVFTSELFLVIFWGVLEYSAVFVCFNFMWFSRFQTRMIVSLISICVFIGLVCYAIHYKINGMARFINGLIPYGIISITFIVILTVFLYNLPALSRNLDEK